MGIRTFNVMDLGKVGLLDPEQMGYKDSLEIIKDESFKVQKSFVKIGWYLKHIRDHELYLEEGYANIYECASSQLGYSQPTVSRFINICEKFSKGHNSPELDEKYAGFDKSQMIEMLPMEEEQIEKITSDMTVKQIREIKTEGQKKREISETEPEWVDEDQDIPGQTSIEEDYPEYLPDAYAIPHKEGHSVENEASDHDQKGRKCITRFDNEPEMPEIQSLPLQPELMVLKNDQQRKEWLNKYKEWGLWYKDEYIDVNYYKFDFEDGSRLIVAEYPQRHSYWSDEFRDECYYHLLEKGKKGYKTVYDEAYRHNPDSETYLITFLKNLQKREGKKR